MTSAAASIGSAAEPGSGHIFVLSPARSGSTLTRFILDTHPEVYCPAELNLGQLAVALYRTVAGLEGQGAHTISIAHMQANPQIGKRVAAMLDDLVGGYARRKGKRIWCEKTPDNLEHRELLAHLYPDARFICLYRHVMDLTQSCLVACRGGFMPVLRDYIRRTPDNSVGAIVSYWVDSVAAMLDFERSRGGQTLRLRYEDLVADPDAAIGSMFQFLGLRCEPGLADQVFVHEHTDGLGDSLIRFTKRIEQDRVGGGRSIPVTSIPIDLRRRLDPLLAELAYTLYQDGPRRQGVPDSALARGGGRQAAGKDPQWVFETLLAGRLREEGRSNLLAEVDSYLFVVRGDGGGSWVLRNGSGEAQVRAGEEAATCRIELESSDLLAVVRGEVDVLKVVGEGRIQISGRFSQEALRGLLAVLGPES
ncbi:MAG TPA: sulfotransferase [Thermoanaerobaculia bacterium]|nr:sulfotransferase [Thermoanaerobaculia bacterium]